MEQMNAASHGAFGAYTRPIPPNEPVKGYAPNSPERARIKGALEAMAKETHELPLVIGGKAVTRSRQVNVIMPHSHAHVLGNAHQAEAADVAAAIDACAAAAPAWSRVSAAERAAVFLKAADLLAGPWRDRLNAATMLGQSKTVHQAEIDAAAELIDFLRFNVHFMDRIYAEQPLAGEGMWNRVDYRPLEGFVFAVTPFNFTAIAGNLPCAPALMGNTVLWKPAATAALSAHFIMELLIEAGLPPGVINLVQGDAAMIAKTALSDERLAGVHFTGSTAVFDNIRREVASRRYRNYPRIVGETGGKNFVLAHASADQDALVAAIIRGAFEYQGQKCSAASRVFVPSSHWSRLKERLVAEVKTIRVGDVRDFANFMGAVIDVRAFARLSGVTASAKDDAKVKVVAGGTADKSTGFFIAPTIYETSDLTHALLRDELFGPIATVVPYEERAYADIIGEIDRMSPYALTGSVFARERDAILMAADGLRYTAGNFYVNDKPTGAVVGQQPFGGARASGTNDKAGSLWNLMRWVSPRTIKETFSPPVDWRYPFLAD